MRDYLEFVWQSAIHPNSFIDLLPAIQLILAVICWYYMIRAGISIYQDKKQQRGKE